MLLDEELSPSIFVPVVVAAGRNSYRAAQVQKGGGVVTCAGINYLAIVIAAVVAFCRERSLVHEFQPKLRSGAWQDRRSDGGGTQEAG